MKKEKKRSSFKTLLQISVLLILTTIAIPCYGQQQIVLPNGDTCNCLTNNAIKGAELLKERYISLDWAYKILKQNYESCKLSEMDLKHKSELLILSNDKLTEALSIEMAIPKTIQSINPDWWKWAGGGTAAGILISVITYLIIHK